MINFQKGNNNKDSSLRNEDYSGIPKFNYDTENYSDLVEKIKQSFDKGIWTDSETGEKKEPVKSLYNTALDITQKQISDDEKHGDWETTEKIDSNFEKLLNAAKQNEGLKKYMNDVNLDDFNAEPFVSSGQKYRNKYINTDPVSQAISAPGNVLRTLEYNISKPIADGIHSAVPGSKGTISTDDVMSGVSSLLDIGSAIGGSAIGGAVGSSVGGVGAVPGAVIGASTLPAIKSATEVLPDVIAGVSKKDPVTGKELDDEQALNLLGSSIAEVALNALSGPVGFGAGKVLSKSSKLLKPAINSLTERFPNFTGGLKNIAKKATSELGQGIAKNGAQIWATKAGQGIGGDPLPSNFLNTNIIENGAKALIKLLENKNLHKTYGDKLPKPGNLPSPSKSGVDYLLRNDNGFVGNLVEGTGKSAKNLVRLRNDQNGEQDVRLNTDFRKDYFNNKDWIRDNIFKGKQGRR